MSPAMSARWGLKSARVDTFSVSRPQEHGTFTPKKPLLGSVERPDSRSATDPGRGFARTSELSVQSRPLAGYPPGPAISQVSRCMIEPERVEHDTVACMIGRSLAACHPISHEVELTNRHGHSISGPSEKNVNNMFAPPTANAGDRRRGRAYTHRDQGISAIGRSESTEQRIELRHRVYLCTDGRLLVPLGVIRPEA